MSPLFGACCGSGLLLHPRAVSGRGPPPPSASPLSHRVRLLPNGQYFLRLSLPPHEKPLLVRLVELPDVFLHNAFPLLLPARVAQSPRYEREDRSAAVQEGVVEGSCAAGVQREVRAGYGRQVLVGGHYTVESNVEWIGVKLQVHSKVDCSLGDDDAGTTALFLGGNGRGVKG